jgi:hypothetical protein
MTKRSGFVTLHKFIPAFGIRRSVGFDFQINPFARKPV